MEKLAICKEYTKTEDIAKAVNLKKSDVSASISKARHELAKKSIIIVNKHGHGYKIGNAEELTKEIDKTCKRALAHLRSMQTMLKELRQRGALNDMDQKPENIIRENVKVIKVVYDKPIYEDFDSYDDFKQAVDEFENESRITSDYIKSIPDEYADQ